MLDTADPVGDGGEVADAELFWSFMQNGQWSVETTASSFIRSPFQRSVWWWACLVRSGVEHTHLAPSKPGRARWSSSERYRYCGQVSAKTFWPRWRASATSSSASDADMWTTYSGTLPATRASWIARLVASPSSSAGRVSEWNCGIGVAAGERLGDQHVDGDAVLGVHHDHRPGLAGVLHGRQDLSVVGVEHTGVGHEQLEAGPPRCRRDRSSPSGRPRRHRR